MYEFCSKLMRSYKLVFVQASVFVTDNWKYTLAYYEICQFL